MGRLFRYPILSLGLIASILIATACAESPKVLDPSPAISAIAPDRLKTDAIAALRRGDYERSSELLRKAAASSTDPATQLIASWVGSFNNQYEQTLAGRKAEHDKAVQQARFLLEKNKSDYALEAVARAQTLALDKRAFRAEGWVSELIKSRAAAAEAADQAGEHHVATRIYASLGAIDQADPIWKNKLKSSARYVRIQALYAPAYFKTIQQAKQKEDDQVDAMLQSAGLARASTTKPTTRPSDDDDMASIDWRDVLKGIEFDMVPESLRDTVRNYYRDVDYRMLTSGGLQALRAFALTPKIDATFPSLADASRRGRFLEAVDKALALCLTNQADDYGEFKSIISDVRNANRQSISLPDNVLAYEFMDGAMGELDPFSSMIWPQQVEEFKSQTDGEFSGVGIQIERAETGDLKVVSPIEDTPAYRAGIKAGDLITHINGELARGMLLDQAVRKIKGPTGTRVTLTVRSPDGSSKNYTLKRDTVKVASIKGWRRQPGGSWDYVIDPVQKIGYVRLTNFSKTSADDLERSIEQMQKDGVRGLILDLRSDPGGLLNIAVDIANMFVKSGTIVSTRADRAQGQSPSINKADPDERKYDLPLVVLVNQYSASASEIVSGALKDHSRALIVGERTYGKGSVQMLFPLSGRSAMLKLTTHHYYLPSGRCLHREETSTEWGVDPDFTIQMTPDQVREIVEARQQMDVLYGPSDAPQPKPTTRPVNLLDVDPQLSAAVMLMRLEVAGVKLQG